MKPDEYDMDKESRCCWKGFDHEQNEGSWNHQYEQDGYLLETAPHATANLSAAIAALSELYRKTKALGATHMTGGDHEFYKAAGYKPAVKWTYWKKQ